MRAGFTPQCSESHGSWHSNPDDCTKFFICLNGEPIPQQCHSGQYYNELKRYCQRNTGQCNIQAIKVASATIATGQHCGIIAHGSVVGDPNDPRKYSVCESGFLKRHLCNVGEIFDKMKGYCINYNSNVAPNSGGSGKPAGSGKAPCSTTAGTPTTACSKTTKAQAATTICALTTTASETTTHAQTTPSAPETTTCEKTTQESTTTHEQPTTHADTTCAPTHATTPCKPKRRFLRFL